MTNLENDSGRWNGMRSLQSKIILTLALCMGAALFAVLIADYVYINTLASANTTYSMKLSTEDLANSVDSQMYGVEQSTKTMAQYAKEQIAANPDLLESQEGIDAFVSSFRSYADYEANNTNGAITSYFVLNPYRYGVQQGFFLTRDSIDQPMTETTMTNIFAYPEDDMEHVGWYYVPIENGAPMWMSPYYNDNIDIWMISYVIPLFDDAGEVIGITGMDLDFTLVVDLVKGADVFDGKGTAALFDASGDLLYQEEFPLSLDRGHAEALKEGDASRTDSDRADIDGLRKAALESAEAGKTVLCTWNDVGYRVIGRSLECGMMLVAMVPENEIQGPIWGHLGICAGIAVIIMLLSSVVAVSVTRSITRPLRNLASASREISEGNLDVAIDTTSKDEVGQLALSFKKMASDLRERMDEISGMAYVDSLTGVGNRAAYKDAVDGLRDEINAGTAQFALVVLDLNGLKQTNDTYGHEAGDELIVDAARAISNVFGGDSVYRYGGDEFAVVVRGVGRFDAERWPQRIEEAVACINDGNLDEDGKSIRLYAEPLSIAWGIAVFDPSRHATYEDAFNEADADMYSRKVSRVL